MDRDLMQEIQKATTSRLSHAERAYAFGFLANWFDKSCDGFTRPCVLHQHIKPMLLKVCNHANMTHDEYILKRNNNQLAHTLPANSPLRRLESLSEPAAATAATLLMMIKEMNEETPEGVRGLIHLEERKAEVRFFYREARKYFKETLMTLDLDDLEAEHLLKSWERDMQKAIAHDYNLLLPLQ